MAYDVIQFFMWLLGICISSIDRWLFILFAHVLIELFLFIIDLYVVKSNLILSYVDILLS